jgi:voltage-gated potassium channel
MSETRVSAWELLILALCVYVLAALGVQVALPIDTETSVILTSIDNGICLVFLIDFLLRLRDAADRWQYFRTTGWIDLLSSIPAVGVLRAGRFARVVRILRLIRVFCSSRQLLDFLLRKKAESAFAAATATAVLVLTVGSIGILICERDEPESSIKDGADALWWAFVTMTTVGYGDMYPVTNAGRVVAAFVMITGVGLFGTFSGFVASWFLEGQGVQASGGSTAELAAESPTATGIAAAVDDTAMAGARTETPSAAASGPGRAAQTAHKEGD